VIGLTVPGTPLLPETYEHYSAYFALLSFAATNIDMEIDRMSVCGPRNYRDM
jgi:hypothetical protein